MNKSLSVYKENYYRSETYRFAVCYLRARSPEDTRAPRKVGYESLDEQRQLIAQTARANQTIIVAEFIDYGYTTARDCPGLGRLCEFTAETGIRQVFTTSECFLHQRSDYFEALNNQLFIVDLTPVFCRSDEN